MTTGLTSIHGRRIGLAATGEIVINRPDGVQEVFGASVRAVVTTAQVLALNATAIAIVPAPGAGLVVVPTRWAITKPAGTAYAGIATGEDLELKYTDASGAAASGVIETTGFLDQTTIQHRMGLGVAGTPVANAAVVIHLLVGEITTGASDLWVRVWYDLMAVPV